MKWNNNYYVINDVGCANRDDVGHATFDANGAYTVANFTTSDRNVISGRNLNPQDTVDDIDLGMRSKGGLVEAQKRNLVALRQLRAEAKHHRQASLNKSVGPPYRLDNPKHSSNMGGRYTVGVLPDVECPAKRLRGRRRGRAVQQDERFPREYLPHINEAAGAIIKTVFAPQCETEEFWTSVEAETEKPRHWTNERAQPTSIFTEKQTTWVNERIFKYHLGRTRFWCHTANGRKFGILY